MGMIHNHSSNNAVITLLSKCVQLLLLSLFLLQIFIVSFDNHNNDNGDHGGGDGRSFSAFVRAAAEPQHATIPITSLGVPSVHHNSKGYWRAFSVPLSQLLVNMTQSPSFTISVTPYSGSVELYMSIDFIPNELPCSNCIMANAQKNSYHYWGEFRRFFKTSDEFPKNPNSTIYVSVRATEETKYTFNAWTEQSM